MSTTSSSSSTTSQHGNNPATMLLCTLCQCPYDNADHEAKLLSCHHSACVSCLRGLAAGGRTAFRCPQCRRKTTVPRTAAGVDALPENFYVSQMRDVVVHNPDTGGSAGNIDRDSDNTDEPNIYSNKACAKHLNQPLLFFCETCMLPICMNCTVLDHDRNAGHRISDISSVLRQHNDILRAKVVKMEQATETFNTGLRLLKRELSNLETTRETSCKHVEETFKQLSLKLEVRKQELLKTVQDTYMDRKEGVVTQAQVFKRQAEKISAMRDRCHEITTSNNAIDPIQAATNLELLARIDELCQTPTNQTTLNPYSHIQFQYEQGLQAFVECTARLGKISCDRPLPTVIKYDVPEDCTAGLKSTISVMVKSIKGEPLSKCPLSVKVTDPESDDLPAKLTNTSDGVYSVEIRPQIAGSHQISLSFLDFPIWGQETDFEVLSNNPVLKLPLEDADGKKKQNKHTEKMNRPTSVALCEANGNVYVADMGNKRVLIYNSTGKLLAQFKIGSSNSTAFDIKINAATEELLCTKVATGEAGQTIGNTIVVFSLTGERKQHFVNGELRKALFLAVNSKGQIAVTDSSLNALVLHSKEGVAVKKVGGQGQGQGQFNFPSAVCIGKDDMILVSDTRNNRVQIFSKTGKFLHEFGNGQTSQTSKPGGATNPDLVDEGSIKGRLFSPRGIAADDKHVLVADGKNRVQVFKYDGTYVASIESQEDPIQEPYNMSLTKDGHVWVADFKNNCVKKYRYK